MRFLKIQKYCLNAIGYSFNANESRFRRIYTLLSWLSLLIIIIPEMHFVIENISDIPLATDAMCTLLTCILSLSKVITIYLKREKFYDVINELERMWLQSSRDDRVILERGNTIDSRLTLTYLISSVVVAVLYLLFPIIKASYEVYTTGSATWIMPMRSKFIYDISISPNYQLTFLWFVQCTYLTVVGAVGVDCLFYGSSFNISSHFQIIQKTLRNLKFDKTVAEQNSTTGRKVVICGDFRRIIQYHGKLLKICDEFSNLYSGVLFTQFLITSVQLCVIAFQLTLPHQNVIMKATFLLFLLVICFQLFTYCHAGSQLTTESSSIAVAIYDSCWYESAPSTRKSIAFFIMRSQKSIIMFSGFYEASLMTFKAILSAAGSYIAILQSLSE